jgi:hypothetical protein
LAQLLTKPYHVKAARQANDMISTRQLAIRARIFVNNQEQAKQDDV